MSPEAPPPLGLGEAVPLVSALVDDRAERAGLRSLVIKGEAATAQGLRAPRTSGDVDVLVDPSDHGRLVAILAAEGWVPAPEKQRAWFMTEHSVTLRNPLWPCEIDAHSYYPGFLADPGSVFDVLWERRAIVEIGGRRLRVCGEAGHAAVLALHGLRDTAGRETDDAYRALVATVRARPELVVEIATVAARTGANDTLSPFLKAIGAPEVEGVPTTTAGRTSWELLMAAEPIPSLPWLEQMSRTAPWRWPGTIWRAFLLDAKEIERIDAVSTGPLGLWRARLRRLGRGVRNLPRGLAALARVRRSVRR